MLRDKLKRIVTDNKGRIKEAKDKVVKEQRKSLEKAMEAAAGEGKTEFRARKDEIFPENMEYFKDEGLIIRIVEKKNELIFSWE